MQNVVWKNLKYSVTYSLQIFIKYCKCCSNLHNKNILQSGKQKGSKPIYAGSEDNVKSSLLVILHEVKLKSNPSHGL